MTPGPDGVENGRSGLRKICSLRVTSETCGRSRGDLYGQKSMADRTRVRTRQGSRQARPARYYCQSVREMRGALQEQTWGAGVPPCRWIVMHVCMCSAWRWRHQAVEDRLTAKYETKSGGDRSGRLGLGRSRVQDCTCVADVSRVM